MPSLPKIPAVLPISPALARTILMVGRGSLAAYAVAPEKLGTLTGLTGRNQRPVPLLLRYFGIREGALSALLATASPAQRALHLKVGLAVDVADGISGAIALKTREVPTSTAIIGVAAATGAVALGITALSGEKG